ncbi:transposase [Kitasatospora sp. NPDC058063]|uniref:transposase n=1 Tax=Kitasatospora sp. NPDC058063 TaxID=3346321 RepID=UPI0036DE819D
MPLRRGGARCTVQKWYQSAHLDVPAADLSEEQWELVRHLLPQGYRDRVRRSVDAIFAKARTGLPWPHLRGKYGSTSTASKYFTEWAEDGTWAELNSVLADVERVPTPALDLTPPTRIEGRVDPRVILIPGERSRTGS